MACNWQYDNPPSNKRVWWVVITITVIGKILILVGIIGGYADHDCFHKFRDCRDTSTNEECTNYYDELCSIKTWTGLIIAGAVVWVFGACFTSYFCCCSQPVKQEPQAIALQAIPFPQGGPGGYPPQQAVVGVPMAGGAAYAQHPYAYPPPGAYGGPPPGHWPQGAPPPPYPGAPPPMQQPFHQPELTTATVLTQGLPNSSAPETSASTAQWKGV